MSTAEASAGEARVDPLSSWLGLDQEPEKGDEAAPHEERERQQSQQHAVAASGVSSRGDAVFTASFVSWLVVSQLAWLALLGYLAYRLFQPF